MQTYYEMKTPKGIMRGYFHKPNRDTYPVCLIFHGFTGLHTGTKFSYVTLSRMLETQGIGTVRLDFLGSGDSDLSFKDMTFENELECACQLIEEVNALSYTTDIYVLGHSMGGVVASELAKKYPHLIKKMCLWAPAFNLPKAVGYLKGEVEETDYYDHGGFQISDEFVKDIVSRDFYTDLHIYQNPLFIIHGTKDTTVPYQISKKYLDGFHEPQFKAILNGTHNFDKREHIEEVIDLTYQFFIKKNE